LGRGGMDSAVDEVGCESKTSRRGSYREYLQSDSSDLELTGLRLLAVVEMKGLHR
jgi:hypothetical protein